MSKWLFEITIEDEDGDSVTFGGFNTQDKTVVLSVGSNPCETNEVRIDIDVLRAVIAAFDTL